MNKGVLVTDLQPRYPPFAHVWHVAVRAVYLVPAANKGIIRVIKILEAMQIMQVPFDRSFLAVDFQRVKSLVTSSISC